MFSKLFGQNSYKKELEELQQVHTEYYKAICQYVITLISKYDPEYIDYLTENGVEGLTSYHLLSKLDECIDQHIDDTEKLRNAVDMLAKQEIDSKFLEK